MIKQLMLVCGFSLAMVGVVQADGWYSGSQWQQAAAQARQEGRPLLTMFVHQGCPACAQQDYNLQFPQAQQAIAPAVKVRVEFSDSPILDRQFNVDHTPTTIITSSAYGGEVYRQVGAISASQFAQLAPSIRALVTKPAPRPAAHREYKKSSSRSHRSSSHKSSTHHYSSHS
jgi:hypothetical protein